MMMMKMMWCNAGVIAGEGGVWLVYRYLLVVLEVNWGFILLVIPFVTVMGRGVGLVIVSSSSKCKIMICPVSFPKGGKYESISTA